MNGWIESPQQIDRRKARILAGVRKPQNVQVIPAMTRAEWEALPEIVRYFLPWNRARRPLTIKHVQPQRAQIAGARQANDRRPAKS